MKTVYITRRERFNAAHKLWNEKWSEEKNFEVFGKCANKNWHGHNFELFVTVKGCPDPETGFIMNLKDLSKEVKEVSEMLDHKNLNLDVPFMKGIMASTENLCIQVWEQLIPRLTPYNGTLHSVKIKETENNFAEYFGN